MEASRMPQGILEAYTHQNLAMHGKDAVEPQKIRPIEALYQDFRTEIPISRKT
jgi:hypothetical protein